MREGLEQLVILINQTVKRKEKELEELDKKSNKSSILEYQNEEIEENNKKMSAISKKITTYLKLLGILKEQNNNKFIKDTKLIKEIFNETNPKEELKRKILLDVLKHNKSVYYNQINNTNSNKDTLNVEEVKYIFKIFDYDFNKLSYTDQEYILNNGNIDNIKEVFNTLIKLNFPKIDISKEPLKLIDLLINSDSTTITEIVNYSKPRKITQKKLLTIISVLTKSPKRKKNNIIGKSNDYVKNIEFLEDKNISINFIYDKCKKILTLPNSKLVNNYNYLTLYNLEIKDNEYNNLTNTLLNCLLTNNYYEIIDKFLEISIYGYDYISNNIENILKYTSPKEELFYRIYLYNKNNNCKKENNITKETDNYKNSYYNNISHKELSKEIKDNIYIIHLEHEFEFKKALNKSAKEKVFDLSKADKKLLSLEKYTDITNKYRYIINGIIISKPKVKRIYNILKNYNLHELEDSLLFSVTYNTFMTESEFNMIKKTLEKEK